MRISSLGLLFIMFGLSGCISSSRPIASSFYHYRRSFGLNCRLPEWQSTAVLGPAVPLR